MSATRCASSSWCRGRRVAGPRGRRLRRLERVPAAALLADEAVLLERGQDAVQVVLLDAHRLGHLGDGDAGARPHELERLLGARAAAARPAAPAAAAAARAAGGAAGGAGPPRRAAAAGGGAAARRRGGPPAAHAVERGGRRLEAVIFVNEGAKLLQACVDLTLLLFQEIGHVAPALYSHRLTYEFRQAALPDRLSVTEVACQLPTGAGSGAAAG